MNPYQDNEIKVKVATRQQTVSNDTAMVGGLLLLILVSVVVLIGRPAGLM